jgi:hypothetical protein
LPQTVFDIYERIILNIAPEAEGLNSNNRQFARTALSLICSGTSEIPDAGVLVEASRFNVPKGVAHHFTVEQLTKILGCLIKVNRLKRRHGSIFGRENDNRHMLWRISPAHYTVKEFLFAESTAKGPVRDFALTLEGTLSLELRVVFNGLQQFPVKRPTGQRFPTPYEEYCLIMSDKALRENRALIESETEICKAVLPCLESESPHHTALCNKKTREVFSNWACLASFENGNAPAYQTTSALINLILLKWPKLMKLFLSQLDRKSKDKIWTDQFTMFEKPTQANEKRAHTVLQLCVLHRRKDLLEILIEAGANFTNEPSIVLLALKHPYGTTEPGDNDDGTLTHELLTLLLDRGANPQPEGFLFTPLQSAVLHLEERWVTSLLYENINPNLIGLENGEHPHYEQAKARSWHSQHPLQICREAMPSWHTDVNDEDESEQIEKSRAQIMCMLKDFGAVEPVVDLISDDSEDSDSDTDVVMR